MCEHGHSADEAAGLCETVSEPSEASATALAEYRRGQRLHKTNFLYTFYILDFYLYRIVLQLLKPLLYLLNLALLIF